MKNVLRSALILVTSLAVLGLLTSACARRVTNPTNGVQNYEESVPVTPRAARPALTEVEVTDTLQKVLAGLPANLVQFDPPANLTVGATSRVEARMARTLLEDLNKALITKGWKVDALVGARVSGDNFEIHNLGAEDQMVGSQEFTAWTWDLVPMVAGAQTLKLNTTLRVVTASGAQYKALPVIERAVTVAEKRTGGFLKFLQTYWAWILGVILVAGIVAILVIEPSGKHAKKA